MRMQPQQQQLQLQQVPMQDGNTRANMLDGNAGQYAGWLGVNF
jgi:hypothetical protein